MVSDEEKGREFGVARHATTTGNIGTIARQQQQLVCTHSVGVCVADSLDGSKVCSLAGWLTG